MGILGRTRAVGCAAVSLWLLAWFAHPPSSRAQQGQDFFTLTPCRLYDTRWGAGPLVGGFDRFVSAGGYCGIPPDATAVAANFTVINPTGTATLSAYPCCSYVPNTVQGVRAGRTLAGHAVIRLGSSGRMACYINGPFSTAADLVVDVSGYFRLTSPIQQWQEWEETLFSPQDYAVNGGDPYGEVELDVLFTNAVTGDSFVQPAFWDGEEVGDPSVFKVRTALPAGNWTWQVASCTRNGASCLAGWYPNQGWIFVQSNTTTGNPLYDRGFPHQVETVVGGQLAAMSELVFPDGTKFDWLADTAWAAPAREIDPDGPGPKTAQTAVWDAYLANRQSKGFTAILIAPAIAWPLLSPFEALPSAEGTAFKLKGNSSTCPNPPSPIPNTNCWTLNGKYWTRFKKMVTDANAKGLLVAVVGVMNPVGIDPNNAYPDVQGAKKFARELVARLNSAAVMFSPAFDDDPDAKNGTRKVLMDEVGKHLKAILPKPYGAGERRALSNHLASAKANCDEYQAFTGWMTHWLFQSGHGGANDTTGPCAPKTINTAVQNAMMRARVMPATLHAYNPKLPPINAEGPYDPALYSGPVSQSTTDKRYRIRQAGYLSALSNAIGVSYGAYGLTYWDDTGSNSPSEPATYFNLPSAFDMKRLKDNFKDRGLLVSHTDDWIKNNPLDEKYKMVLASNEVSFVMAYLPGDEGGKGGSSEEIKIDATKLPCQSCPTQNGTAWSFSWVNPVTNNVILSGPTGGSCSGPIAGQLTLIRPACRTNPLDPEFNPDCDWVLKMEKTGTTCPAAGSAAAAALETWSDTSAGDGTASIYAAFRGPTGPKEAILLSPPGKAFQITPRVDRLGSHQIVVWQADGLDGSLYGVYGALVDPRGEVSGPFKINHYTEHDQREPAVAGGPGKKALVVWSSYGQDRDQGGIFGRLVSAAGPKDDPLAGYHLGEEFEIAEIREGHQQHPQVLADSGGFWVAWETVDDNGTARGVSVRRLGIDGRPASAEVQLLARTGEQSKLLVLDSPAPDSVVVRWWRQDVRGRIMEPLKQAIGPHGPLGPVASGKN